MDMAYAVTLIFGLFLFSALIVYLLVVFDRHITKKLSYSKQLFLCSVSLFLGSASMVVAYFEYSFFISPTSEDLYPITYLVIAILTVSMAIFLYIGYKKERAEELKEIKKLKL